MPMAIFMLGFLLQQGGPDPEAVEWFRKGEELIGTPEAMSARQAEFFEKAVEIDPDFPEARFNLGIVYLSMNRFEDALDQFAAYRELNPGDAAPYFLSARGLLQLEREEEAVSELKQGLEIESGDAEAWGILASVLLNLERYEESVEAGKKALELAVDEQPQVRYELAVSLERLERRQEAVRELRALLANEPDHYQAHYLLGEILLREGDEEAAARHLLKAESINDSDPRLAQTLGDVLLGLGREEEAKKRLERGDRESASNLANRGVIAIREERYQEAEALLRQALDKDPAHPLIWGHLGDALAEQGKKLEAIAAYGRALDYDPDDLKSLINAGTLAADAGRNEQAKKFLERAHGQAPESGLVNYSLAVVLDRLGEGGGRVQKLYLAAIENGEDRPLAHFRLAFLFAEQGGKEKALHHLERALEKDAETFYPRLVASLREIRSELDSIRYTPRFAELLEKYRVEGDGESSRRGAEEERGEKTTTPTTLASSTLGLFGSSTLRPLLFEH